MARAEVRARARVRQSLVCKGWGRGYEYCHRHYDYYDDYVIADLARDLLSR